MSRPNHRTVHLLAYLRDLERHRDGYWIFGAPGWATLYELADAVGGVLLGEELGTLARRGELVRVDARVPGAKKAVWAYRIPDEVAQLTASLENREHIPLPQALPQRAAIPAGMADAQKIAVILSRGVALLLQALVHAAENSDSRRARLPDQPEWRTMREINTFVRELTGDQGESFNDLDVRSAEVLGLLEKHRLPPPPGLDSTTKTVIYRVTQLGKSVFPLPWHERNGTRPQQLVAIA